MRSDQRWLAAGLTVVLGAVAGAWPGVAGAEGPDSAWDAFAGPFDQPNFSAAVERMRREGGFSIRFEDRFSDETTAGTAKRGVVLRMRLGAGERVAPYAGGGFGRDEELFRDYSDGMTAGRLIGGLAAPLSAELHLFGEYQNVRPIARDGAFHRALFGIRRSF